jgi:hypothetical protein
MVFPSCVGRCTNSCWKAIASNHGYSIPIPTVNNAQWGNDRFCARLKTDISAFSSGLQGYLRSCLTILDSSRRPLSKNVRHDLVRPQRPELEAEMSVFNLAQKRSFPPLCNASTNKNGRRLSTKTGKVSLCQFVPGLCKADT